MDLRVDDEVRVKDGSEQNASHKGISGYVKTVGKDTVGVEFDGIPGIVEYDPADLKKELKR